jgi:hypothetical protein
VYAASTGGGGGGGGGAEGDEIASIHDEMNCGMSREAALEPSRMLDAAVTTLQGSSVEERGRLVTGVGVAGGGHGGLAGGKGGEVPSFSLVLAACRHALKRSNAGRHHECHGLSSSTPADISNLSEAGVLPFGFPAP